jgi:hypothetical protein
MMEKIAKIQGKQKLCEHGEPDWRQCDAAEAAQEYKTIASRGVIQQRTP